MLEPGSAEKGSQSLLKPESIEKEIGSALKAFSKAVKNTRDHGIVSHSPDSAVRESFDQASREYCKQMDIALFDVQNAIYMQRDYYFEPQEHPYTADEIAQQKQRLERNFGSTQQGMEALLIHQQQLIQKLTSSLALTHQFVVDLQTKYEGVEDKPDFLHESELRQHALIVLAQQLVREYNELVEQFERDLDFDPANLAEAIAEMRETADYDYQHIVDPAVAKQRINELEVKHSPRDSGQTGVPRRVTPSMPLPHKLHTVNKNEVTVYQPQVGTNYRLLDRVGNVVHPESRSLNEAQRNLLDKKDKINTLVAKTYAKIGEEFIAQAEREGLLAGKGNLILIENDATVSSRLQLQNEKGELLELPEDLQKAYKIFLFKQGNEIAKQVFAGSGFEANFKFKPPTPSATHTAAASRTSTSGTLRRKATILAKPPVRPNSMPEAIATEFQKQFDTIFSRHQAQLESARSAYQDAEPGEKANARVQLVASLGAFAQEFNAYQSSRVTDITENNDLTADEQASQLNYLRDLTQYKTAEKINDFTPEFIDCQRQQSELRGALRELSEDRANPTEELGHDATTFKTI